MTVGITELPPEGMLLPGVALAGDTERGTKTTEGISLLFSSAGITVQGPQPQIERLLVWTALDSATCHEVVQLADGREAAVMELTSGGQSIRFLLPTDSVSPGQAAYLDQALPTWLARYKGSPVPAAPTMVAPTAQAAGAFAPAGPDMSVNLPAPGTTQAVAPDTTTAPAPNFATAGAVAAGAAAGMAVDGSGSPASGNGTGPTPGNAPGMAPTARFAAPPAPSAPPAPPAAPMSPAMAPPPPAVQQPVSAAPPPPPVVQQPVSAAPPPPPPTFEAPSAPVFEAPAAQSMTPPPAAGWDTPPPVATVFEAPPAKTPWYKLSTKKQKDTPPAVATGFETAPAAKTPWYKLSTKKPKDATAVVSAAAATAAAPDPSQVTAPMFVAPSTAKTPWYKLSTKKPKAADPAAVAASAAVAATAPTSVAPSTAKTPWYKLSTKKPKAADPAAVATPTAAAASPAKKSFFTLETRKSKAAAAAAAGTAVAASSMTPTAPPAGSVPLAVQPPPPVMASPTGAPVAPPTATGPIPPGQAQPFDASGGGGAPGVVLSGSSARRSRGSKIALVALLVLVVGGGAYYFISKHNSTTPPPPAAAAPGSATVGDTALAASINLHLADLPAGWTVAAPAQAVTRPPVAPAVIQAAAVNTMAACLNSSYSVVAGLFGSGSLPGETSLVESPTFQSAAGASFEMGSKTTTLTSAGQVQALQPVFANPKFVACYQQYLSALAVGAVAGSTVVVQPVTLGAPSGVQSYGVVSTYTIPGNGTQVVGDAYILGGRVVSVLQPSTNGPSISSSVFTPAYNAIAGRVARAAG